MSQEKKYRWVSGSELSEMLKYTAFLYIYLDYNKYPISLVKADKSCFVSDTELCPHKYDYTYLIDENYENTIYIEAIKKTHKQPVGGTVDAPAV